MIYRHRRTLALYRCLFRSFSVERQRSSVVYVSLDTGAVFDRDAEKFNDNFMLDSDPQTEIVPAEPHA